MSSPNARKSKIRGTSPDPLGIQRTSAPGTGRSSGKSTIFIDNANHCPADLDSARLALATLLVVSLPVRTARLSKRTHPFASTSGQCDRSICQPGSAKFAV
jgi:hypothetical protein